jgi:pimeloyl-ACP methyl ester carboxylesterase
MAASPIPVKQPRTYVLIHGWVWKEMATELRYMGHEVYTPSLTGLGDRRHLAHQDITLDTHTDDIVNLILMEQLHNVVLVGWSYGGMVVSNVLALIPDRIGAVMYFDAFVPETGKCLADYAGEKGRVFREHTWPDQRVPPFPLKAFGVTDEKLCERIQRRLVCQPLQTFLQPSKALRAACHSAFLCHGVCLRRNTLQAVLRQIHRRSTLVGSDVKHRAFGNAYRPNWYVSIIGRCGARRSSSTWVVGRYKSSMILSSNNAKPWMKFIPVAHSLAQIVG